MSVPSTVPLPAPADGPDALSVLHSVFGLPGFRGAQGEIIRHVTDGGNCLVLMPTGGGKSLCYQLPALLREGCGIVVSPLIALMRDQVAGLIEAGVNAAALNSSLTPQEASEIERNRSHFRSIDSSITLENFAYPYGLASVWRKPQLAKTFRSARGILPGVNRDVIDLQFLRASPLVNCEIDTNGVDRYFDEVVASGGWLIFYGHDVVDAPSPYGCTPAMLRHALKAAGTRNMPIVTVAEALRRIGA